MKGSELSVRVLDGDMQPPGSNYNWGSRYQQDLQRARHHPCTIGPVSFLSSPEWK